VIYDASVLYPAPLRDFLMWLALSDLFQARWTEQIHDEWIRSVLKNRPDLNLAQLTRTKNLMNANVRDCLVEGYEFLIDGFKLPDPDDRHVLAAAIKSGASKIITFNLKDFPASILVNYGIEAIDPDEFILLLIEIDRAVVYQAAQNQLSSLKNPPLTKEKYLETLSKQRLPQTTRSLRKMFFPE